MKQLWAPWRIDYIKSEKPPGCILCAKLKEKKDRANLVLMRGKHGFVLMNLYPYSNGHLMVSPYQHTCTIEELSDEVITNLMQMVRRSILALKESFKPEGINIGLNIGKAAGAGIDDHLHFHIVPRWGGDTNFMTVTAEIRVIPEDILKTYQQLKPYFKSPL